MNVIPEKIFRELILNGVNEFMYLSYDHDAAMTQAIRVGATPNVNSKWHYLPKDFTDKFPLWVKGKIWNMAFNSDGSIKKIYASRKFKYQKRFNPSQFGVDIKPIIFQSDDKYGLIKLDLACKNNEI